MFTNLNDHGGNFREVLNREFSNSNNVTIASGYASLDVMETFKDNFISIAKNGGNSKLLLGMAFYEGLSEKKLSFATSLNEELRGYSDKSGVFVANNGRRYHGKLYKFDSGSDQRLYLGSSNFSSSGIEGNIECTIKVTEASQKLKINNFLADLYSTKYSIELHRAEIPVQNRRKPIQDKVVKFWKGLDEHQYDTSNLNNMPKFIMDLTRIVHGEKSNLNIYFGKGRLNRSTDKIKPRPWYEVELIANKDLRENPNYPHGHFNAFTDDKLIIPMSTQGDYYKNIRSRKSLQILGLWIKGKLERSGALNKYEPITADTLKEYGNDKITFYKINKNDFYIEF